MTRTFPQHADADLEWIIAQAEKAYDTDGSSRSLGERKVVIEKAASILRERPDEFAKLSTSDRGNPLREPRSEVALCADILDYFAPNLPQCATDGEIAAINLESARMAAWARFARDPHSPGVADSVVHGERLALQFWGDPRALDRLDVLAGRFASVDDSYRAVLVQAQVASMAHRFDEARAHLARAARAGAPHEAIELCSLTIDQACGVNLDAVLAARRRMAASVRFEDLVPLGALLADLEQFQEADAVYGRAFSAYDGTSPFPPAWVCFQLGMLWGELVPAADRDRALFWYGRAVAYLPAYMRARVHLAEIHASLDQPRTAEALLVPVLASGDPEVPWRLADVLMAQERRAEADIQLETARTGFEALLRKHLLAFADHAAEFYAGSGNDLERALELARANLANRPTRRALKQVRAIGAANPV